MCSVQGELFTSSATANLICRHEACEAFELQTADGLCLDDLLHGRERTLSDQDLRRCRMGASRDVRFVTGPRTP
jgi:hypothetical protein